MMVAQQRRNHLPRFPATVCARQLTLQARTYRVGGTADAYDDARVVCHWESISEVANNSST